MSKKKKEEEVIEMYRTKEIEQPTVHRLDWQAMYHVSRGYARGAYTEVYNPDDYEDWTAAEKKAYNEAAKHSDCCRLLKKAGKAA